VMFVFTLGKRFYVCWESSGPPRHRNRSHDCDPNWPSRNVSLSLASPHHNSPMGKSRFRTFDAFQKTVEEARIRTASGGLVTIVSACIIFSLLVLEIWDWRRITVRNELVVDNTRGTTLPPAQFC